MILLAAATAFEIAPTVAFLEREKLSGVQVEVTGVGLTSATYALTRAAYRHRPSLLIQAGIAGALNRRLLLGSTVAVRSESIGDLGVTEEGAFRTLFDLGLVERWEHPWRDGRLVNRGEWLQKVRLPLVNGVTVQEITTLPDRIRFYEKQMEADVESMEGAALHYVGLMEGISFLQLRTISNYVGERDKSAWRMNESISALNRELIQLIQKMNER